MIDIASIMIQWQNDSIHSNRFIHVDRFYLTTQAEGFWLKVELSNNPVGEEFQSFYGSLDNCFEKAVSWIDLQINNLKENL